MAAEKRQVSRDTRMVGMIADNIRKKRPDSLEEKQQKA
jgi:hypothetical protein